MNKKGVNVLGMVFIIIACLLFLLLNNLVFPKVNEPIDTGEYYLKTIINLVRYTSLATLSSVIGMKLLFKK